MEQILIIGGTGNIGFPLIQSLSNNPENKIIAGVFHVNEAQKKFKPFPNVQIKKFDFLDSSTFFPALEGVTKVFFIRPPQLSNPKQDMLPFLKIVKKMGIKQIVFVSLIGVEKNPITPHHKIEKMIKELGIPFTFIRPSFFMQNLNTTHKDDIQKNRDLFVPAGNSKTSFIDTRDIGEVAAVCLTSTKYLNMELEITGSEALTYHQIAQIMTKELGIPIRYSKPSLLKFRKIMIARGTPKEYANVMTMLYFITQLGNAKKVTSTLDSILKRPATDFKTYVKDYKSYFI
ncbi:SDR family oxidoreductase (plasmid) [Carnobacterium maltaromaticum]|uniref:SDR family oxidoreductase n=1 Tax=Carnobacterium maltaromaticum TaxID=2751 RepID=UPI0034503307